MAALSHLDGFLLPCGVDHFRIVRDDWLEGKVFVLVSLLGLFVLFGFLQLVLTESIDYIRLEFVLLCNYIVNLLADAIDQRFFSKVFGLFFIALYLFLVESIGL